MLEKGGQVLSALFICTFLRIYKFRSLQEPPAKPAHLQLVPSALDSVTWNHIFKRKQMERGKKNEELCWMVEEKGWSWRSWRSRTGQQAHILQKCRRKCVGRAGIWIHDGVRHNSIHGSWKHACPPYELGMEFAVVVEGNGDTNDKSIGNVKLVPG